MTIHHVIEIGPVLRDLVAEACGFFVILSVAALVVAAARRRN